jgi:hypothetical protein
MSVGLSPFRNNEEAWLIQSAEVSIRVAHVLARFVPEDGRGCLLVLFGLPVSIDTLPANARKHVRNALGLATFVL